MSRYRTLDIMMWGDEKFRELSPIAPCAAGLWVYLLTGPHTTSVPGLFSAGERQIAEALQWPLYAGERGCLFDDHATGFREAWQEIESRSMAFADWRARVVWLPRAIHHNRPSSPNVVRGWWRALAEVPECRLKEQAVIGLRAAIGAIGPAYLRAFDDMIGDAVRSDAQPTVNTEFDLGSDEQPAGADGAVAAGSGIQVVAAVVEYMNARAGTRFSAKSKATARLIAARLREGYTVDDLKRVVDAKCADWLGDPKMRAYLRPETLFNATKFESYLNGHAGSGAQHDVSARNREALRRLTDDARSKGQ